MLSRSSDISALSAILDAIVSRIQKTTSAAREGASNEH